MHDGAKPADRIHSESLRTVTQPEEDPLVGVELCERHATSKFCCSNSERVQSFLRGDCLDLIAKNYCRVFVVEDARESSRVLGYYSTSASVVIRNDLTNRHQRHAPKGIPVPVVLIGFMGRDDSAPKGLGAALILDAARRVVRNRDIAAWGLALESEGGPEKQKLWNWYISIGFTPARTADHPRLMYAPLSAFMV
jgi:hypothetical protein